jgi:type IV pilus assembly protein PilY1
MKNRTPIQWRKVVASLLSLHLALGPIATPAYGAVTKLADEPIAFTPSAEPSVVLTVDDSTSMLSDFLPDYIIGAVPGASPAVGGFCRFSASPFSGAPATGSMSTACGYGGSATSPQHIWSTGNVPYPTYATGNPPNAFAYSNSTIPDRGRAWAAPVHSNALNRIYYDPAIDYRPPVRFDGTSYPDVTTWTAVDTDPWDGVVRTVNLTSKVSVGMFCNTDWPNDINWDPAMGGGKDCRINGTDYSAVVPATNGDYQYPWKKTTGANDAKYYYYPEANNTSNNWNKVLWCDTSSPRWPKNCTTTNTGTYSCPTGQTWIPPTTQPQTCVFSNNITGCTASTTTCSPANCNTNPLYGSPGLCVGPECLPCSCSSTCTATGITGKQGYCRLSSTLSGGSGASCRCSGATCTLPACPSYTSNPAGTCSGGGTPVANTTTTCSTLSGACNRYLLNPSSTTFSTTTMLADANGAGEVCRRNNQSYPDGTIASPFNYSSAHPKYKTPVNPNSTSPAASLQASGSSCETVPYMASVWRHYWKTSVEWCATPVTAVNDKWLGYGLAGTCQDEHDAAHPYPRFYKWGVPKTDPAYLDNYANPAFERVDLSVAIPNYTHTYWKSGTWQTITRTYTQEMTNYANWFAYYRTRIQAAKTVISQNFTFLDTDFMVGFHTLSNDPPASFVNPALFDAAVGGQKDKWYQQLFGIQIAMGKQTPNIDAVARIGELFKNGGNPSLLGSNDPIKLSCQKNYHMLFTDGITNQAALPSTTVGNLDDIVPPLPQPLVVAPPIVAGSPWPNLYREDTSASMGNTLADYTTHYWVTDMRPAMTNNVLIGKDPAPWQHLNFAALSLGTEGVLTASSPGAVEAQIAAGTVKWPTPYPNSWKPGSSGVDDLWHAAVNARGRFVNAKTSQQLGRGIAAILSDITSPAGSNVGATFANPNLSPTNDYTYITKFVQGWGGGIQKIRIDPISGAPLAVIWDAEAQLIAQTTPTVAAPTPWYTERRIVTMNEGGAPVPFVRTSLGATQASTLGTDAASQDRVVEFLRGRRDNEGDDDGQFRVRPSPLGDIVNSQPVLVGPPDWDFVDATDPGYASFKLAKAGRPTRLYVGANDGMLHAFDDATGNEAWAFVPPDLYRKAPPAGNDKNGLLGLTYQPGGLPLYSHRFYVDATPRVVDVAFGSSDWRTLLVTGLGKGGNSYYGLDVTDPASITDEASAANKVLWRFTDADMGYTFGRPTIAKTRAHGWVVVVSAGYNNASGEGKLFFLRASDGALLKTMSTGAGSAANPSGLVHFSGYTQDYRNQVLEQIYAGDLLGNVWRFDVSDANDANWVVERFAVLTDAAGVPQPITTPPRVDIDIANGIDRWVFVGTGRLLHEDDLSDMQSQRMYAMRDGTYKTPSVITSPLTWNDLDPVAGVTGLGSGVIATRGWYDDLPAAQRIVKAPVAAVGLIAYVATGLPTDPCEVGQPATVYVRQIGNGESRLQDGGGDVIESVYVPDGAAGLEVVAMHDPACTANCIPDIRLAVVTSVNSQLLTIKAKLPAILGNHRISWRQLGQ